MSYALGQTGKTGIQVGARAARDPILGRASLEAAQLLVRAAKRPREGRAAFLVRAVGRKYGVKTRAAYRAKLRGGSGDQGLYDALRLAIADYYVGVGMRYLQKKLSERHGERFIPGPLGALGDEGQDIGCAIGGGATALISGIVGAYTAGVGAPFVGAGGTLALTAAGCGAPGQQAAQDLAAAEAAAAAAAALAEAERQRLATEQRGKTIKVAAIIGGAVLGVGVLGYVVMS